MSPVACSSAHHTTALCSVYRVCCVCIVKCAVVSVQCVLYTVAAGSVGLAIDVFIVAVKRDGQALGLEP